MTVSNYLIAFNAGRVPDQTTDELPSKSAASQALLEEMEAAGVLVFAEGGIGASTLVCSVVSRDSQPVVTDGAYAPLGRSAGRGLGLTTGDPPVPDQSRGDHRTTIAEG